MSRMKKAAVVVVAAGAALAGTAGTASADGAHAKAKAKHSPGVISGNVVQVPINIPINVCGNTVNVIAILNPAFGNVCINDSGGRHHDHHHGRGHGRRY